MIDALTASRSALLSLASGNTSPTTDSGKLFITGYSQRRLCRDGNSPCDGSALGMTVTASAPMSGPYRA